MKKAHVLVLGIVAVVLFSLLGVLSCKSRDGTESSVKEQKVLWQKDDLAITSKTLDGAGKVSDVLIDRLVNEVNTAADLLNLNFVEVTGTSPLIHLKFKKLEIIENSRWTLGAKGDLKIAGGSGKDEPAAAPAGEAGGNVVGSGSTVSHGVAAALSYNGTRSNYNVRYTFNDTEGYDGAGLAEIDTFELDPIDMWKISLGAGAEAKVDAAGIISDLTRLPKPLMKMLSAFLGNISLQGSVRSDSLKDTSPSLTAFKEKVDGKAIYPVTVDIAKKFAATVCENVLKRRNGMVEDENACRAKYNFDAASGQSCLCSYKVHLPMDPDFEGMANQYRMMKITNCKDVSAGSYNAIYAFAPKDFYLKQDVLNIYGYKVGDDKWFLQKTKKLLSTKILSATVVEPAIPKNSMQKTCGAGLPADMACMELQIEKAAQISCRDLSNGNYGISPLKDEFVTQFVQ